MWGIERDSPSRTTLALCRFWAAASLRRRRRIGRSGSSAASPAPATRRQAIFPRHPGEHRRGVSVQLALGRRDFSRLLPRCEAEPGRPPCRNQPPDRRGGGSGIGGDEAFREIKRPVLVLAGTKDQSDAGDRSRTLLPDCHFMFVYDAGRAIGAERPAALAYIVLGFLRAARSLPRQPGERHG